MGETQAVEKVAIWIGVDVAEQLASQNAAELPKSHIAVAASVDFAAVMVAVEAAAKAAIAVAASVAAAGSPGNYIVAAAAADREIAAAVAVVEAIEEEEVPILAVVPDFATAKVVHIPEHKMAMKLVNNQTSWHSSCIAHCFPHCTAAATVEPLQEIE